MCFNDSATRVNESVVFEEYQDTVADSSRKEAGALNAREAVNPMMLVQVVLFQYLLRKHNMSLSSLLALYESPPVLMVNIFWPRDPVRYFLQRVRELHHQCDRPEPFE